MATAIQTNIREAQEADRDAVFGLWSASGLGEPAPDEWRALIEGRTSTVLVAEDTQGRVLGTAVATFDGWRAYVYHVVVAERFRRQGIGHELMRAAQERLVAAGARYAFVTIRDDNTEGLALAAELGYMPEGEIVLAKPLGIAAE